MKDAIHRHDKDMPEDEQIVRNPAKASLQSNASRDFSNCFQLLASCSVYASA
jgi:hypothetical protein